MCEEETRCDNDLLILNSSLRSLHSLRSKNKKEGTRCEGVFFLLLFPFFRKEGGVRASSGILKERKEGGVRAKTGRRKERKNKRKIRTIHNK